MSFAVTKEQMRARTKTVTRRLGWLRLLPGEELLAVERSRGLKKGERVVPIGVILVVSVRRERLDDLVDPARPGYGAAEMALEGFPGMDPQDFMLRFFVEQIDPSELVTRIQFSFAPAGAQREEVAP